MPRLDSFLPVVDFRSVQFRRGKGSWVWDSRNDRYFDACSGQFGATLGHSDPGLRKVVTRSFAKLAHLDTYSISPGVVESFRALQLTMPEFRFRGILLSTGAEANEFALRYSKYLQGRDGVISFTQGYLGQTLGTAGYSDSRARVRPLVPLSFNVPAADPRMESPISEQEDRAVAQLEKILATEKSVGTIVVEPIVSGAGVLVQSAKFLRRIRELASASGAFLIFDECQTGAGRAGPVAYFRQIGVVPDFVVLGKGIGAGFPLSVVLANKASISRETFEMKHFSSHQNEPVQGEVLNYVVSRIGSQRFHRSVERKGQVLRQRLQEIVAGHGVFDSVRGEGLLLGLGIKEVPNRAEQMLRANRFVEIAVQSRILIQSANFGTTIRILPSLLISDSEIEFFCDRLDKVCKLFEQEMKI